MKLTINEFITLDGVMQSPGSPQEDPGNGFAWGGWQAPFTVGEDFGRIVGGWFDKVDEFLLGRSTFEMMRGFWSNVTDPDNEVATKLNGLRKNVVSASLTDPDWPNVSVISTDVVESVRALKGRPREGELQLHGSWQLARTLHDAGLVDEYRLLVFPVVIGTGKRLFDADTAPAGFTLEGESEVTKTGLIHQVLRPATLRIGEHVIVDGKEAPTVTS